MNNILRYIKYHIGCENINSIIKNIIIDDNISCSQKVKYIDDFLNEEITKYNLNSKISEIINNNFYNYINLLDFVCKYDSENIDLMEYLINNNSSFNTNTIMSVSFNFCDDALKYKRKINFIIFLIEHIGIDLLTNDKILFPYMCYLCHYVYVMASIFEDKSIVVTHGFYRILYLLLKKNAYSQNDDFSLYCICKINNIIFVKLLLHYNITVNDRLLDKIEMIDYLDEEILYEINSHMIKSNTKSATKI